MARSTLKYVSEFSVNFFLSTDLYRFWEKITSKSSAQKLELK